MTPEEIIEEFENMVEYKHLIRDFGLTRELFVEHIRQYAREMCEVQKSECWYNMPPIEFEEHAYEYACLNAPYPKELQ